MGNKTTTNIVLYVISFIVVIVIALTIYALAYSNFDILLISFVFIATLTIGVTIIIVVQYRRYLDRQNKVLFLSMVGFAKTGKTVYWTVLLKKLMNEPIVVKKNILLNIKPQNTKTINDITLDYSNLIKKIPPASTPEWNPSRYRADIVARGKSYTLIIGDYAGESFKREQENGPRFLSRTPYFKSISNSDMLFFAIDLHEIYNDQRGNFRPDVEKAIANHLLRIQEEKRLGHNKKINFPIALIFLKHDLTLEKINKYKQMADGKPSENMPTDAYSDSESETLAYKIMEEDALSKFSNLINFLKYRCVEGCFEYYFISSLGVDDLNNLEGDPRHTENIAEPLRWAIDEYFNIKNYG